MYSGKSCILFIQRAVSSPINLIKFRHIVETEVTEKSVKSVKRISLALSEDPLLNVLNLGVFQKLQNHFREVAISNRIPDRCVAVPGSFRIETEALEDPRAISFPTCMQLELISTVLLNSRPVSGSNGRWYMAEEDFYGDMAQYWLQEF